MSSPEIVHPNIEPITYNAAYSAVVRKIIELGPSDLTVAEDERKWSFVNDLNDLAGDTVVGQEAIIAGVENGVGHFIRLAVFNEALGMADNQQDIVDIRLFANGDGTIPYPNATENYEDGVGHLRGLIWFNRHGSISADFGHGTTSSENPNVQLRMEELLLPFGLPDNIFELQSFYYDEKATQALAQHLPQLV